MLLFKTLTVVISFIIVGAASAQMDELEVKDAWARATPSKATTGAVYLSIMSPIPDRLISASAPVANKVDLMTIDSRGGMMKMRYVDAIDVPANKAVVLNPDGLHVWLAGLKQPLKAGNSFPLTLTFEKAGQREVIVSVLQAGARGPMNMNKYLHNMDMDQMKR